MNDSLPPTDQAYADAIRKYRLAGINVMFEAYGRPIVQAVMHRPARMWVMGIGGSFNEALAHTARIIEKVIELEKLLGTPIKSPPLDKQQFENGYYREFIHEDKEVEFKRQGDRFVITNIQRKDAEGFYYAETPWPVGPSYTFVRHLENGEDLYSWNDLGYLSGSAGSAIVKDGKVIKTRGEAMA